MPDTEVLILAMTRMLSGVCTAGMTREPDETTGLRWVRPVKDFGTLLLGDLTDAQGRVIQLCDVVSLHLQKSRPSPPHAEDWLTDFVRHRPRLLRRLEGDRRASFLRKYQDTAPHQVLVEQKRSLCLIRPDQVWGRFTLDPYSGKYEARLAFSLGDQAFLGSASRGGLPVTDLKWRALGRAWLSGGSRSDFDSDSLHEKLAIDEIYLTVGLSRTYEGQIWSLVLAVHTVPDYDTDIDYTNL
jgi:hypothetical protein